MNEWTFSLQSLIRDLNYKIFQLDGITLPEFSMDPLDLNAPWAQLIQFQQMANNFSALLNVPGYDFQDVNLQDRGQFSSWVWLVFTFMKQCSDQLGVS